MVWMGWIPRASGQPSTESSEAGSPETLRGSDQRSTDQPAPDQSAPDQPGFSTEIRVENGDNVKLHVDEVSLAQVLRLLSIKGRRNIIASPKVTGTVTANLYDVPFLKALKAILASNQADYFVDGDFIYVYTLEELAEMQAASHPSQTRVFHLNYINSTDAKNYVTPIVGTEGKITESPQPDSGISSDDAEGGGQSSAGQDFIIVTARPEILDRVEQLLREVDVRPVQVLVEAILLRAALTDDNALGIDFTLVGGVDLELLGASSNAIQDITLGALPEARLERFNANATTDLAGDIPNGGLTLGIIKDNAAVFLRALEQVTDTTVIANPKVLALNKQKGQVMVGRRDGYITTTLTETQAVQTVKFLETGTRLIFRPFVGNDGFIRVELHPEDSVGFVSAQGLPSEQTTEVTTNIIVRDGETILIGGLFREVNSATRKQIPGLGNLPAVGTLFRSNDDSISREEVIILLTIHVVRDQDAYVKASRSVVEEMEHTRIGSRRGMMWHSRDRLAQIHYHRASEAMEKGHRNAALWHVNLALMHNSRFTSAIDLKEQITADRIWEGEEGSSRDFIYRLIEQEKGYSNLLLRQPVKPSSVTGENSDDD